jgi:hypothetical protein
MVGTPYDEYHANLERSGPLEEIAERELCLGKGFVLHALLTARESDRGGSVGGVRPVGFDEDLGLLKRADILAVDFLGLGPIFLGLACSHCGIGIEEKCVMNCFGYLIDSEIKP